jgi:hypothetical protein
MFLKRLLLCLLICCPAKSADVTLNLVSSNQFKAGTNSIWQAVLGLTNIVNLNTTNVVNVLSFGAVADGLTGSPTDNQVAISNAWISIASGSGKILFFPPGVYRSRQLNLTGTTKNNYYWSGAGAIIKPFETNNWQLSLTGSDITFRDITFDADFKTIYNIFQNDNSTRWSMYNVKYLNPYLDNVMDPTGVGLVVNHLMHNVSEGNLWVGCVFSNNTFATVGNVSRACKGIYTQITSTNTATWAKNHIIVGNKFYKILGDSITEADCISIQGPNGNNWDDFHTVIANNVFDQYTRRAIKLIGNGFTVIGNDLQTTITNSVQFGGISGYGGHIIIANNNIKAPFFRGIEINGSVPYALGTNVTIIGNNLFNTAGPTLPARGITIDNGSTNVLITGNTVSDCQFGIQVLSGVDGVNILNNQIIGAGTGINISTNGTASITPQNVYIEHNYFRGNTNAVRIEFGTNIVTRFNKGSTTSSFLNRTAGVTGQSLFNGDNMPAITTATLDFPSIAGQTNADLTITVTGSATSDTVSLGLPSAPTQGIAYNAFVSSTDTVTVRAMNYAAGAIDPASANFTVMVNKQ